MPDKKNSYALKKCLYFIIESIIFFLLLWFYASHSLLLPDSSKPYSSSIAYKLQTNAFLQGKILLSPRPFGALHDFLWTEHGMSQVWGLGVPLLRLPFEWAAREAGFDSFPDKWIVLFYLSLMIITLNASLRLLLKSSPMPADIWRLLLRWYLIGGILFSPAITNLINYRFFVYEEVIFYGYVYSGILLALFWIYMKTPRYYIFWILCLLSGLACLIRPTLIFYGLTTVFLASVYTYQRSRNLRLIVTGVLLFCIGGLLDLWLNNLRFGSMVEFGYAANLSGLPANDYNLRFFDYPFRHEPFLSAAKELVGALFFNHWWESPTFRNREITFASFNILYFVALLGGALFFIISCFNTLKRESSHKTNASSKILYFSLAWGLMTFSSLFIFYLRCPYMTARYLCDFATAFNAILIMLILFSTTWLSSFSNKKPLAAFLLFTGILLFVGNGKFLYNHDSIPSAVTKKESQKLVASFNQGALLNPSLPDVFYCGHPGPDCGLSDQFAGWDVSRSCLVSSSSSIYLPSKKCLTLKYSYLQYPPSVQVKKNLAFLRLDSQLLKNNQNKALPNEITQRFCTDTLAADSVALYTIGWVSADRVNREKLPIILNWISVSDKN